MEFSNIFSALGLHLTSAGAVYGIAHVSNEEIFRKRTSLLFLCSILFRPLNRFHSYLYERLEEMRFEAYYPRADLERLYGEIENTNKQTLAQQNELENIKESFRAMEKKTNTQAKDLREKVNEYKGLQTNNRNLLNEING